MSSIYLIRHGEITSFKPRRYIGRQDLPLTPKGRAQIARMAEFLSSQAIDRVICSPLSRCVQSAEIIEERLGVVPQVNPRLAEIDLGSWEGLTVAEVCERYPGQYEARGKDIARFRPPGGESFQDLLDRTWPAFQAISSIANERITVVAHSGVNRVLLCRILDIPLTNLFRIDQDYGCLNILHYTAPNSFQVNGLNVHPR
jgi:alpha-ribazole phosphatase